MRVRDSADKPVPADYKGVSCRVGAVTLIAEDTSIVHWAMCTLDTQGFCFAALRNEHRNKRERR